MIFERPQHAHFERGHHDHESDRPCEYVVGLEGEVGGLAEAVSYKKTKN